MDYANRFTKDDVFILGDLNIRGEDTALDQRMGAALRGQQLRRRVLVRQWRHRLPRRLVQRGFNAFDKGITHTTRAGSPAPGLHPAQHRRQGAVQQPVRPAHGRAYNLQFGPGTINDSAGVGFAALLADPDPRRAWRGVQVQRSPRPEHGAWSVTDHCSPTTDKQALELYGDARYGAQDLLPTDQNV